MYGAEEKCIQNFDGETLREGDHVEDPGLDGTLLLKLMFEK